MSNSESKLTEQWNRQRQSFIAPALKAEQEVTQYGLAYDADEVFGFITAKVEGKKSKRPSLRKL
jgi:hypothetical protein